jgi:dTDP-4-amino-4,6-dideoxygalactose transaminase
MNETTGAVGLAQIRKADRLISRRRATAGLLTSRLKGIPGLLMPEVGDCTPSWWDFTFQIEESGFSVDSQAFALALQAEGIPFGCGYIPNAVFEYPVVAEKITWGKSQIPWSLPQARPGIEYDIADYPGTSAFLSRGFVFNWNEGITESDVEDMAKGICKVAEAYRL